MLCFFFYIRIPDSCEKYNPHVMCQEKIALFAINGLMNFTYYFLMGVHNLYAIEIYPTAVSGLGNGFMRMMGVFGTIFACYVINI